MGYRNLLECVRDLEASKELVRIDEPIDPHLEMAEIQRRVFRAGGPALLFTCPKDCRFPMLGNLFGTMERMRYLFRDTLDGVKQLVKLQVDPLDLLRRPMTYLKAPWMAWHTLPKRVKRGPVLECQTTIDQLPQLKSWPDDGGAYVTLPQVYTEDPRQPGPACVRTWACIACSSAATATSAIARSDCITRSIAASACTTPRPWN